MAYLLTELIIREIEKCAGGRNTAAYSLLLGASVNVSN